jgi:acyl-CoA dehydrogenase
MKKAGRSCSRPLQFFEKKGKKKLKEDYHNLVWYADFIEFLKENDVFSTL